MNIKRHFIFESDPATGENGLIPMWVPKSARFNASHGLGVLHDTLEHAHSDRGYFHQEIAAFGRMLVTRLSLRRWGVASFGESFGKELAEILSREEAQSERTGAPDYLVTCPHKSALWEPKEWVYSSAINAAVDGFIDGIHRFHKYEEADLFEMLGTNDLDKIAKFARGWLTYGYFDVKRRYGRRAEDLCQVFEQENITRVGRKLSRLTDNYMGGEIVTVNVSIGDNGYEGEELTGHENIMADWIVSRTNEWKYAN